MVNKGKRQGTYMHPSAYTSSLNCCHVIRVPSAEVLKELSDSRYTVYDVLPAFFNHEDPMVTLGMPIFLSKIYS